jgi:hypothetical protein
MQVTYFEVSQVICFQLSLQQVGCLTYLLMHQLPVTQLPSYSLPQKWQLQWNLRCATAAAACIAASAATAAATAAEGRCYEVRVLLLLYVWLAEAAAGCYV